MKKGFVSLIGAGPGDPGLITVKGRDALAQADVVVYDYLASPRLLVFARPEAELVYVGKKAGAHTMKQEDINALLVSLGLEGKQVARLKGGDPYVFGRGSEEALALGEAGVEFEVVPGITSGIAALAYAGIPLTHRGAASNAGFVTGHETPDKEDTDLDYETLARWKGTLVFYMGVRNLESISGRLVEHGMAASTPAALVRWGTTAQQRVVVGTLENIAVRAQEAGMKPPALFVVGEVVDLRDKLNWFERRPLFGKTIVVTRSRAQSSELAISLERLGADVVQLPAIRVEPPADGDALNQAVGRIEEFDWVVFNSANAVEGFFSALFAAGRDARALAGVKVSCVGPATRARLQDFGLVADLTPARFDSDSMLEALGKGAGISGLRILCPRSDIAPEEFVNGLTALGAEVVEAVAYRTVAERIAPEVIEELFAGGGPDWITFTSSSTAGNFLSAVPPEVLKGGRTRLASIGPQTSERIRQLGLEPDVEATQHTMSGLVQTILQMEDSGKES